METAMLPEEQVAGEGEPVEEAEATRTAANLFKYSQYVHAGAGAEECENCQNGKCADEGHFHAWVCMPNSIQHRDILEKARAAKARRKRALRDAGGEGRPASDAYVMLESDLDDTLADPEQVVEEIAARSVRKGMSDLIREVIKEEERFETYYQDAEEWRRQSALDEEQRSEEYAQLDELMTAFEDAVKAAVERDTEREREVLGRLDPVQLRETVRTARIDIETAEAHLNAYYLWLGFIGTRVVANKQHVGTRRYFNTLEDFRNASPEAVQAVDDALRDLEGRMNRGDAAGN